ncbi:hypothetical protein AB0P17_29680 [Streptomyces sp. NPDC088124]|uniref:hypothetical protein n=1 Tax=Streptomyces sp. NPDC088124 TaxID=3154654 RepID=UPI003423D86C
MSELRADTWINSPQAAEELLPFVGQHMVAHPIAQGAQKSGGQLIGVNREKRTASLRRYDTGEITEFPWTTTRFRHTTFVKTPYAGLKVGDVRRFDWYVNEDGQPIDTPRTLVGTVDSIEHSHVSLWVRDPKFGISGGWWAHLKNQDTEKHALRPTNSDSTE